MGAPLRPVLCIPPSAGPSVQGWGYLWPRPWALVAVDAWLILVATGLAAGVVSGLMGVGGGIVMTPVLHYFVGLGWTDAVALSLFVIAVQSPVGIWRHHRKGAVSMRVAGPLVVGGAVGVVLGIWLEPRIGVPVLKAAFAVLMVAAGYRLVDPLPARRTNALDDAAPSTVGLGVMGAAAGVVSRLLGVGGGIVTVPMLVLGGVVVHVAVASSLVPVWTNAAVASGFNLAGGLDWMQGLPLAIGAVVGAPLGVSAAHRLAAEGLRKVVASGLLVVALLVLVDALDSLGA